MAQSNQTQNAAALAVNSGEYFESYHMNDNWDSTWEVPLFPDNDCWTLDWQNGQGGLGMESADGVTWNKFFWPSNAWPVLPSGGAGVDWWNWNTTSGGSTYFWNIITNSSYIGPGLVQEHCIASAKWPTGDEQRTADAKMNLATGGEPGSTAMNLWVVSASAIGYTNLYDTEGYPIPFTNICAGVFGYLDASGHAYMVLPDNTNVDVTPYVPGNDYYSFSDPPEEYTPKILWNGTDVTDSNVTAVVGQLMNLTCQLQDTNGNVVTTPAITNFAWTIPGNTFSDYVATATSAVLYTNFPTMSNTVNYYWVDGGNKQVSCAVQVAGQTLTAQTAFTVSRPEVTWTLTPHGTVTVDTNYIHGPYGYNYFLRTGNDFTTNNYGMVMSFQVTDLKGYAGDYDLNCCQLIAIDWKQNLDANGIGYSKSISGKGLDTTLGMNVYVTWDVWAFGSISLISGYTHDSPAMPLDDPISFAWRGDGFEDYLMFTPAGGKPVPIKLATWNWYGTATHVGTNEPAVYVSGGISTNQQAAVGLNCLTHPQWTNNAVNIQQNNWQLHSTQYPTP